MASATAADTDPADLPDRLITQLARDEDHTVAELVEILTHNAAVTACADYRTLQAAGAIYEDLDLEYGLTVENTLGCGPFATIEELAARTYTTADIRARFGPDGMEQAIALIGAALTVPAGRARRLIIAGTVMRTQLPMTGTLLACGRIDLTRMLLIIDRTALVDPDTFEELDAELAVQIGKREPMSITRFRDLVDTLVARIDPDAARLHRERGDRERHITIRPDRTLPGQSRVTGTLPAARAAAVNARLDAMAAGIHREDGRTHAQLRADALIALAHDDDLHCHCPTCTPPHPNTDTDTDTDTDTEETPPTDSHPTPNPADSHPAPSPAAPTPAAPTDSPPTPAPTGPTPADPAPADPAPTSPATADAALNHRVPAGRTGPVCPKPTFHIIVSLATLLGANNTPAYLDGHGVLHPDIARELVTEATRSYIHTPHTPPLPPPHEPPHHRPPPGGPPPDHPPGRPPVTDSSPPPAPPPVGRRNGYVPARSIRALVTAAELCCVFPGCTTPVHRTDLDHTTPHNRGGTTTTDNLKPLCRLHHRIKTFTPGWRDYQTPLGDVFFTTPTGHTFLGNAFTGRDIFTELRPPRARHHTPAHTKIINLRRHQADAHHRARQRDADAHPPPF